MRDYLYILDDEGHPQPTTNHQEWAEWWKKTDRHLRETRINNYYISTIFLGINHNFVGKGKPVLWETMIFRPNDGLELNEYQWRYASKEAAIEGHEAACKLVRRVVEG